MLENVIFHNGKLMENNGMENNTENNNKNIEHNLKS